MTSLLDTPAAAGAATDGPASGPTSDPADGPPGGGLPPHPVTRFVDSLGRALDQLAEVPTWSMTPAEQRDVLVRLHAQRARLTELEMRVLVSADRNDVGKDAGATSTAAWLAHATGSTRSECFRELSMAESLDDCFEATRRALAAGVIDVERAEVVMRAVARLDAEHDDLPEGTHASAEEHMLDLAGRFDAVTLRRLGKRLFEVICPDAADEVEGRTLAAEEERATRLAYVSMRDNGDGTSEGRFRLPTLHAELLKKALETLTSPRRLGQGRRDAKSGRKLPLSTLMGQGLMELLERHLDLKRIPSTGGSPFTLVVTIGLEALMSGLGAAGVDTGHRISAGEARRLACRAGIIPMVLDGRSVPLDLGRKRRRFSKHQRLALQQRYGGCAADTCDRPPAWVEAHHEVAWRDGGRTDLALGIPLCPPHHHMADHPESWNMTRLPSGGVRFSRRQ